MKRCALDSRVIVLVNRAGFEREIENHAWFGLQMVIMASCRCDAVAGLWARAQDGQGEEYFIDYQEQADRYKMLDKSMYRHTSLWVSGMESGPARSGMCRVL